MKSQKKKAQRQSTAPKHQHINSNKHDIICLSLFILSFACMIAGSTTGNEAIKNIGAGIAFACLLYTTHDNLTEDK